MRQDLLKGLNEEQIEKVRNAKNADELLALAKEEGFELSNEQLEAINGGCGPSNMPDEWYMDCPYCAGGKGTLEKLADDVYKCKNCGNIYRPSGKGY